MITDINNVPIDQALQENGYVIVDNLIPEDMIQSLKEACDRSVKKARNGKWKHCRYVGTQFPPWTEGTDVTIIHFYYYYHYILLLLLLLYTFTDFIMIILHI